MTNNPLTAASVIIPTYNGLRFLPTCLDALRRQTYPAPCTEVILVDDASSDGTLPFVQAHYPEVRVVALPRNCGLAAGCNAGASQAHGDLLVLLNNDTEVEPGWLAALVAAAEANPRAGAIASKMLLFDRRDTLHTAGDVMGIDGVPRNRGVWQRDAGQYDGDPVVFGGCGGGVAYRRVGLGTGRGLRRAPVHVPGRRGSGLAPAPSGLGGGLCPTGPRLSPVKRHRRRCAE